VPFFRKRPVVIEAHQWWRNGDHPDDYSKAHEGIENDVLVRFSPEYRKEQGWEGDVVRYFRRPEPEYDGKKTHDACGNTWHDHGWIDTLEGGHTVCPGDWIITGVQGERYPCKPDIFEETYEPAEVTV
jgi:hypothetical protein